MPALPPPPARHILSYAQTLRGGGVERVTLRLARDWVLAGRRVTLVIGSDEGPLRAEIPDGVETIVLGSARYLALLAGMPGHVAAVRPDVLFCPGNHYTSVGAWTRLRLGTRCPPAVAKVSNALVRSDQPFPVAQGYRAWLRLHRLLFDQFVAMTPAMAIETRDQMGVAPDRITVIANPPARPIPGAVPPPLPAGRFILGVGRLVPQKRWDRLIAAMPRLADRDVALVILGEGAERPRLAAQIATLGLGDRILMPGNAADPLPVIGKASVVALVSDFEGVPGVLREALALGTPVISTDSSVALHEIVSGPELGTVVPVGDGDALVAALDHWLSIDTPRPAPVPEPGQDAAAAYLALFDRLVAQRSR